MELELWRKGIRDVKCLFVPSWVAAAADAPRPEAGVPPVTNANPDEVARIALNPRSHFLPSATLQMGDSIGPDRLEVSIQGREIGGAIGTFGGFLRLRRAADRGDLGVYAFTNYHVARWSIPGLGWSKEAEATTGVKELPPVPESPLEGTCDCPLHDVEPKFQTLT